MDPASAAAPKDLFDAARAAAGRAHAPYSRYAVGAALRDGEGRIHAGCNVENAAYPQGTCAEAGAIAAMVLAGGRRIAEALVYGEGGGLTTPCGGCRQKLREFGRPDLRIHVADSGGVKATFTLAELLPHAFGPDNVAAESPRSEGRKEWKRT